MWATLVALALSAWLVMLVVLGPLGALWTALAVLLLGGTGLVRSAAVVEVRLGGDGELRAGRARLPLSVAGAVVPLDAERAAHARGPGIDARAYHLLRGWVPTAVLVEVRDPRDPTPYWYVSTRRPERLARALEEARPGAAGAPSRGAPGDGAGPG
ncbi:DUF3093 domain-containing protein [Vallicoccus soli]|uniref:DUF3093 domain-containing protein n=2 Tax=Vallicoccus soli TaxID=2339232 RepID=A0A3A3YXV1_9ACTN|nr:DUF3093 domain-containing protein [Vallicoccus soli]